MSLTGRFAAYAAAFEQSYAAHDFSRVAPFFTEQAVYDAGLPELLGGRSEGRAAILDFFSRVTQGFDRRFATRELALLDGPHEAGRTVWLCGRATYRAAGVPELVLELEERVIFESEADAAHAPAGARIRRLDDHYAPAMRAALVDYAARHGAALGFALPAR
jgi:hypothetical protein